jgi:lysozyme
MVRLIFIALVAYFGYAWYKKQEASDASSGLDTGSWFYFSTGKNFSGMAQTLSDNGLNAIKQREGFSSARYEDPQGSGKYSIGYGHQIKANEILDNISENVASQLLYQDTASAVDTVNSNISADLTQPQFDALVSFVFNVGAGAFIGGSVPEKINSGDLAGATNTMKLYIHAGGITAPALVARRAQEVRQFYA